MILRTPAALWLVPVAIIAVWLLRRNLRRTVLMLRIALLTTLSIALAEPLLPGTPVPPPLLVLVDQSVSLPAADRARAWNAAQQLARSRTAGRTVIGAIGEEVRVAGTVQVPAIAANGTDLAAALRLAQGFGGQTVLISDGAATTPGTDEAAQQLRKAGVVVDVVPLSAQLPPDARVSAINLPAGLRADQAFKIEVVIDANAPLQATLLLDLDGERLLEQPLTLKAGRNPFVFDGRLPQIGVHIFQAKIYLQDAHPENDQLDQPVLVGPAPKVLVIERTPDSAAGLRDTLEAGGIQSEARRPVDLATRLSELERFDAIVLNDVPATDLSLDQQATLREYVRSLGHGLLVLGGANSYGLGGYKNTPLETVLPVEMQPPPRRERQQVALLLIVDRSASMYGVDPQKSKLELAKAAAIAAVRNLGPDDQVAIQVFDTTTDYAVPFTTLGGTISIAEIENQIAAIDFGGGTNIYDALAKGLPDLALQTSQVKHAVLLTDGRSYSRENYDTLIEDARVAGITLSTIAIGNDADLELLKHLAEIGEGRYSFASNPQDLPRLTLQETEIARSDPRVEGRIQPQAAVHPAVRGLVPSLFPPLDGYVATTPKPNADVILRSPQEDTLLAAWQFGLGRALAWTSDSGSAWAPDWQRWPEAPLFWTQILAYTFPDPSSGSLIVRVAGGSQPELIAEARDPASNKPLDLADVGARIAFPNGSEQTIRLRQTAPGRYSAPVPLEAYGGYKIGVALRKGDVSLNASTGYVKPYAAEFAQAPDRALLTRIAQTTGGQVLPDLGAALSSLRLPPPQPDRPLWPWLIALSLLLWIIEIAVRRNWLWRSK